MKRKRSAGGRRVIGLTVFGVALAARLLFWQATPDRAWPHSVLYKGDAITWTEYAAAIVAGEPFELGLPLRPPGNAYLLAALGVTGPADVAGAKLAWCLLGALAVTLFYRAARENFGEGVGVAVALWCAFASGLLTLSTSLNNETPYLVLVALALLAAPRLAAAPKTSLLLGWGAVNGLACLFRVEHVLYFALATAWVLWRWRSGAAPAVVGRRLAILAAAVAVVLAPWHVAAWGALHRFNTEPRTLEPAEEAAQQGIERTTAAIAWSDSALAARDRLPAFMGRTAANFVAATVFVRGGREVREKDFGILEEAFGYYPEPLPSFPFVTFYGPLNFYLANRAGAPPGFDPGGLARPPRLAGGAERYPRALLVGVPPARLAFTYPPHLEVVNDGYRIGWRWIRENPGAFFARAGARLVQVWRGAALGWTGHGLPWGWNGTREAVDLAVPAAGQRGAVTYWRLALLGLCLAGAWRARREPALPPWLLFAAAKLVAAVAFFGYARHGATLIPVVALTAALALAPAVRRLGIGRRRLAAAAVAVAALALASEAYRWLEPPVQVLDGRAIVGGDPFPPDEHPARRLEMRR